MSARDRRMRRRIAASSSGVSSRNGGASVPTTLRPGARRDIASASSAATPGPERLVSIMNDEDAHARAFDRLTPASSSKAHGAKVQIIKVSDMATLCLARPPLTFLEVVAKRLFDIVGAALGLVLLLPFFLLIAALIRLDSPGPAVFRQQRYGFNQKPFWIYKFRTMRVHDDHQGRQATGATIA